jgi:membrane protein DedA with SNARE-associated domain
MTSGGELIAHWGYAAIFVILVLGNVGLPVPEETTLIVAGYLAWRGDLQLPWVLSVGVVSAAVGDNIGYWIGRRYGAGVLERFRRLVRVAPERFESMRGFVIRHGPVGVFGARFIAGLRFLAGPLAGAVGVRFLPFTTANVLGALVFVPVAVGVGYAGGYGLGDHVERILQMAVRVEHVIDIAALILVAAIVVRRLVSVFHEK